MRRVVVTGMGMVTPLGCGVETSWRRLIAGESGARKVDTFDVSDLPARLACMIPRGDGANGTYNPSDWMEPKEQRKVDDFIVFDMDVIIAAGVPLGIPGTTNMVRIASVGPSDGAQI